MTCVRTRENPLTSIHAPPPPLCSHTAYPVTVYTTSQEPTAQQRASYREKRKEVGDPETELSCWLLEALAKEPEGHYVKCLMHQRSSLSTLARYGTAVRAAESSDRRRAFSVFGLRGLNANVKVRRLGRRDVSSVAGLTFARTA